MKLRRTTPAAPALLVLAPLINVVLLLLLFFLLGSGFVLQPGVSVNLPFSEFEMAPQVDAQVVTLAPGSPARLFFRNQRVSYEEFAAKLAEIAPERRKSLIVRADKQVPYEAIMHVSSTGLAAGYQVVLATTPKR